MILTVKSKGRPGLKFFVMSVKDTTYGDSTILMPVFSASTRSLPVQEKKKKQHEKQEINSNRQQENPLISTSSDRVYYLNNYKSVFISYLQKKIAESKRCSEGPKVCQENTLTPLTPPSEIARTGHCVAGWIQGFMVKF